MADLLSIGLSGLSANKTSLTVTGHNITNINTPGYSRQDTVQATRTPQFSGAGYIGSGTSLEGHVAAVHGGISLALSRMDRILEVSADALDCRCEAISEPLQVRLPADLV